ncbi:hypothetical protein EDD21DRAFT_374205 [Dissophora ornata]|nr:hypothetical protein BGZ58_006721 [Dissophora ornata]KAI8601535.1 hypothetical protein EDD21DRAFT_374205 [Dissophora ornata]
MSLSPTSITLFLVQIGTFFSGLIVVICCCLYVSAYPKSPNAQSLSPIALGTLAFSLLSTLLTIILILRQKSGHTIRSIVESAWIILATALWILAAVGGIIQPPNGMSNASCKVLPEASGGKDTDDANYIRACQSMFASTAFCIMTALFFIATAILRFVFSVKRSFKERKNKRKPVGGHYKLSMTPSQYRKAQKETELDEEEKGLKGAGEHEEDANNNNNGHSQGGSVTEGSFSENVYRDPVISTPSATFSAPSAHPSPYASAGAYNQLQQQQQQQYQYQQQQQQQQQQALWAQQPAYTQY